MRKVFQILFLVLLAFPGSTEYGIAGVPDSNNDRDRPFMVNSYLPPWLRLGVEQRTRYETFNNSFKKNIPGGDEQIALRTRFRADIVELLDPLSFTVEVADFRAPLSDQGQDMSTLFVDTFDIFQLHARISTTSFLGTHLSSELKVGRFVLDFGKGRLIAGFRFGSFTPAFDGVHWSLGRPGSWKIRAFATQPVQRKTKKFDELTSASRFWGIDLLQETWAPFSTELYYFGLNENDNLLRRELSTLGVRVFENPNPNRLDFEVESMYQFGRTRGFDHFAHRHHGELGYSVNVPLPARLAYLFDYASGTENPNGNFDFLFAKRRTEYGPTGILGIIFPSNILSPVGGRLTVAVLPTVTMTVIDRSFWLADSRGQFVGSSLQDPTSRSGTYLGNLFDWSVQWSPRFSNVPRVDFDVGYSRFFKGGYFSRVPGSPGTSDVDYFYSSVTIGF